MTKNKSARPARSTSSALAFVLLLGFSFTAAGADWQASLTKDPPGKFPPLRPLRAKYNFGWSGFTAGIGDARFNKPADDRCQLEGSGRTIGLARALWRYDVSHHGLADADTLRPIETKQIENVRGKKIETDLVFTSGGVSRSRTESTPGFKANKPKQFNFPNLFDLQSTMLYLRSQPLKDRSVYRVVVYPGSTPYLAALTVTGHEMISVRAGSFNAIKLDLHLNRVGKNLELEPHKKFKRATLWISDDGDRLILRIEAQIFVGSVFAELQSVQFDSPKR